MLFKNVAIFFDRIETTSSRTEMTKLLAELIAEASPKEAQHIVYFSLGTLNPPYISTQFNIAQKSMLKIVAHALHQTLEHVTHGVVAIGDVGEYFAQHAAQENEHMLRVEQLYILLQEFEQMSGAGSQEQKLEALVLLLANVSALEGKYIIRIILGTLRLGFSEMTLIDALSWVLTGDKKSKAALEEAYNLCADLGRVTYVAKTEGLEGIRAMSVLVGVPIRLAAAERLPTAQDIIKKLGVCIAEPKIDGFRLQIHKGKKDGKHFVRFFSRNLIDMSDSFPEIVEAVLALPADTIICEGEAIAYNPVTGDFVSFQETVKRKRKHNIAATAQDLPLRIFLFDLLYLNGELLIDKVLLERRMLLKQLLEHRDKDAMITLVAEVKIDNADELEAYFYKEVGEGLEGVMAKRADSPYQAGKRNFNWIKLKRQESGELDDTLDCVILGYYAGEGKRAKFGMGAFLVGIYNAHEDKFETVAKIGTGLTDAQWRDIKHELDAIAVHHKPALVDCNPALDPDVWVTPQKVVMVRADEITRSPLHTAAKKGDELGLALRFPRYMGDRPDKSATESTDATELVSMFKQQKRHKQKP